MKLQHVTILTDKFEEELRFYQEVIGLAIARDMRPGRNMVFLSNGEGETEIEIIEDPKASDAGNAFLSIGFHTEDTAGKRAELMALGLDVTELIRPNPQVQFFYTKDPAGMRVQFI